MIKIKGTYNGVSKTVEVNRTAHAAEIKQKLQEKFGDAGTLTLNYHKSDGSTITLTTDDHFALILKDVIASKARVVALECIGASTHHAPASPAASSPASGTTTATATATATPTKPSPASPAAKVPPAASTTASATPVKSSPRSTATPAAPAAPAAGFIFCSQCGTKLPADSRFCASCGKPVVAPEASSAAPVSNTDPNVCLTCGKPCDFGQIISALDRTWHKDCFVCNGCKKAINGPFAGEGGRPYCRACHEDKFALRCTKCGLPIGGGCAMVGDKPYHDTCFVCTKCGKQFTEGKYFNKNGEPHCSSCV